MKRRICRFCRLPVRDKRPVCESCRTTQHAHKMERSRQEMIDMRRIRTRFGMN